MNSNLLAIPKRIAELRDILGITTQQISENLNISESDYIKYETGESDIPIGVLYAIADILGVDPTVLLTGEEPRMNRYSITRKGGGADIERYPGYSFKSLAYNFEHRTLDPLIVTVNEEREPKLVTHSGQEFNYVLKGKIKLTLGKKTIALNEGDSIYFDSTIPHGQSSLDGESVFLTVIKE